MMILVGQYDSPFVRRVAVTMNVYGINFERRILSVFRDFDEVLALNPLGKVPILILAEGERLIDSRAILDYLDGIAPPGSCLVPANGKERVHVLRSEAVALGLAEKLYERGIEFARRDPSRRDPAVVARVERQIASAISWLEAQTPAPWLCGKQMTRADVTAAIAITYAREKQPALLDAVTSHAISAFARRCEELEPFKRAAYSATEAAASGWRPEA